MPEDGLAPDAPASDAPAPDARTGAAQWFLARAALITAVLTVAGALLGLGRDRALAHFFGAGGETDAFLVAWTVPEVAATLLIEDGMAFVLVPAFSLALARRGTGGGARGRDRDPVRALVAASLPRLLLGLAAAGTLLIAGAPLLVHALAPGLPEPGLAVDCTRLTGTCAVSFGLAGYCSAALRAHRSYVAPAAIYIAYNLGIIAAMAVFADRLGVRAAALGVAGGGCLMVAVQAPSLRRALRRRDHARAGSPEAGAAGTGAAADRPTETPGAAATKFAGPGTPKAVGTSATKAGGTTPTMAVGTSAPKAGGTTPTKAVGTGAPKTVGAGAGTPAQAAGLPGPAGVEAGMVACVLLFALCRQSQVLVERYLASALPPGAISHLNYAQKVAQMPMALSLMLCTVTFPVVARALAEGDTARARERMERDLLLAGCVVLLGTAGLVACAPALLELLFQQGAFTARDTAATADVLRVYALGLLGHTLVGALVRCHFSAGRPTWYPLAAMVAGALATGVLGAWAAGSWGVRGIAAANAAGITLTALLLLTGRGGRRGGAHRQPAVPVRPRRVLTGLVGHLLAAVLATGAGLGCAHWASRWADGPLSALAVCGTAVLVVYGLALAVLHPRTAAAALRAVPAGSLPAALRRSRRAAGAPADRAGSTGSADPVNPTSTAPTGPRTRPGTRSGPGPRPPSAPESTRILTGKHPHVR